MRKQIMRFIFLPDILALDFSSIQSVIARSFTQGRETIHALCEVHPCISQPCEKDPATTRSSNHFAKRVGIAVFLLILFSSAYATSAHWQAIAPGIDYQDVAPENFPSWSHIHVFRIDLKKNRLSLVNAQQLKKPYASAQTFAKSFQALITVNGGFFDHRFQALGLRIQNGQLINRLKPISWWGVFYIENNHAVIKSMKSFTPSKNIDMAIQSGPRLLVHGIIPRLKQGIDQRTALCVTKTRHVILLVTERAAMSTTKLAQRMKASPLECVSAINLDGGSSSQLFARINNFYLNVPGLTSVSDALIVAPRTTQSLKFTTYPQDNLRLLA